jgi:hypothetical protein
MPTRSLLDVAKELAAAHRAEDPDTKEVFLAPSERGDEVRLVEVSGSLGSTSESNLLPVRFPRSDALGIEYDSIVVLLSPTEWQLVKDGKLSLPAGWGDPDQLQKID